MDINARTVVIIPNWNGMSYLPNCLESLNKQSTQDFEIILVDNGSKDSSLSFIEKHYPDIHIDALSRNVGFGCAVNSGVKEIKKGVSNNVEYIIILHNDTVPDKNFVETFVKRMDENKEFFYGTAKIFFMEPKGVLHSCGYGYSTFGLDYQIGYGETDRGQYDEEREVFGAYAAAAIYRKEFFDKVGLFDEVFFAYTEDMDLNLRAQLMGYKCLYVPSAKVKHHSMGSVGILGYSLYCFHKTKNNLLLILKHLPFSVFLKNSPKIVYIQLKTFVAGIRESVLLSILRAYAFIILLMPEKLISKFNISLRRKILISTFEERMTDYHPYPRRYRPNALRINFLIDTATPAYISDSLILYAKILKMMGNYISINYVYNVSGRENLLSIGGSYLKKIRLAVSSIWNSGGQVSFGKLKGLQGRYIPKVADRYIPNGDIFISTSGRVTSAANGLSKEKGRGVRYICSPEEIESAIREKLPALNMVSSSYAKNILKEGGVEIEAVIPLFLAIPPVDIDKKKYNDIPTILLPYSPETPQSFLEGIEAIEMLRKKNSSFDLVIFGEKAPDKLPPEAKFVTIKDKRNLGRLYWSSDILFAPSPSGWYSQAIMEGMGFGCAIVSTDIKGEYWLSNNKNALLAASGQVGEMADHLLNLLANRKLLTSIAAKGGRYLEKFSGGKMGEQLENIFKNKTFGSQFKKS